MQLASRAETYPDVHRPANIPASMTTALSYPETLVAMSARSVGTSPAGRRS